MNGLNKAYFIGHLGRNPEPRTTKSGQTVASISLATPHSRKEGENWVDSPDWHRLTAFGKTAENLLRNAHVGDTMAVECVIRPSRWTDKEGQVRYDVNLYIERILWIAQKRRSTVDVVLPEQAVAVEVDEEPTELVDAPEAGGDEIPF